MALSDQSLQGKVQGTAKGTLKKLREAAGQGNWVSRLSDKNLSEVFHRFRMGQSARHIARVAKETWGVMPNSSIGSLSRALNRFKKKALGDLDIHQAANDDEKEELKKLLAMEKKRSNKLDFMDRIRWLVTVQTERVNSMLMREREAKYPVYKKDGDSMVSTLGDLLQMGLKLEMDLGIRDQRPSEFNLLVKHRFDGVMQGTLQDGGHSVIAAADKFLALAEENSLTLEEAADGTYRPPEGDNEE